MASTSSAADPVRLLQDLIRCASVTPTEAGVFDVLDQALAPLGFAVTRLSFEGNGSYPVDNLFATRGSTGPHLLFNGHTDVVPPGERGLWTHEPFGAEIAGDVLYGRGAVDMKSGIAAFVAALAAAPPEAHISLAITNDEEADGVNGTARIMEWAAAEGHVFDFAIVGEPSATARVGDSIKIGRRGSLNGRIVVEGVQGHVAYPHKALNPLPVAAHLVEVLSGTLDDGSEHFPASNLEFTSFDVGNSVANVIPAAATLRFNVRYNDRWTPESLEASIREAIEGQDDEGTRIGFEVVGVPSRSFLSPLGGGVEMLVAAITAETGAAPEMSTGGGTSDARFIAQYCPVAECGLPGPTMHKADECVPLADVRALTALYAAFLRRYFGAPA
ncbi:MAG: succinyl-diaminopimelate desuccinylase [Devosia sp. 67-54]|uniref:succinyl-diaminopimelate desuccinylase n=1 Tax=unclassified Devosia TaxID=196773 RepID=UPI0009610941|nr:MULTISPECIES: succinyl-diaminopimelate desuccinylase [unclassified Devosia]MBN9304480.1 succinyl-diaminopimelate desuccinylase [Devosia sp.]OJX15518.1 MAG: succinyl-diaminopimelate desuccinylase [Devosia sp. 67-54]